MKNIAYLFMLLIVAAGCDKEEVQINTGPLLVSEMTYSGTDEGSGTDYTAMLAGTANSVPLDATFEIAFSKEVDPSTVNATNIQLTNDGSVVNTNINTDGNVITISPASNLERDATYNLQLSNDIKSIDGGIIAEAGNYSGISRTINTVGEPPYVPDGQVAYWSFNFSYEEHLSGTMATEVGDPGFANTSKYGPNAFQSASDSYLTFPADALTNDEFSATFWYNVNATPNRAGILVMGPPDDTPPANNRTGGFRFFREAAGGNQRFKLNVGNGTADTWVDGGSDADVAPNSGWVHMAFTISDTAAKVYINGELAKESDFSGVDWTGVDILSIGSGAPRFVQWGHLSDQSYIDELRIFDVALPQSEIQKMIE